MHLKNPSVTVTGLITASCETLFDIVSDPTHHPDIAGSGEVIHVEPMSPLPMHVGSGFKSRQCIGWYQYPSLSYVQVYDRPYHFVWLSGFGFRKPPFGQLWGFRFVPVDARSALVSHMMKLPLIPQLHASTLR